MTTRNRPAPTTTNENQGHAAFDQYWSSRVSFFSM